MTVKFGLSFFLQLGIEVVKIVTFNAIIVNRC